MFDLVGFNRVFGLVLDGVLSCCCFKFSCLDFWFDGIESFEYVCAASGLQVLQENNLIHRDLKPQVGLFLSLSFFFLGGDCVI